MRLPLVESRLSARQMSNFAMQFCDFAKVWGLETAVQDCCQMTIPVFLVMHF